MAVFSQKKYKSLSSCFYRAVNTLVRAKERTKETFAFGSFSRSSSCLYVTKRDKRFLSLKVCQGCAVKTEDKGREKWRQQTLARITQGWFAFNVRIRGKMNPMFFTYGFNFRWLITITTCIGIKKETTPLTTCPPIFAHSGNLKQ